MTNTTKAQAIAETALEAFWASVVSQCPEAKTGDLSPGATVHLVLAAESAVGEWLEYNMPR